MLGFLSEGLALLRAVDPAEADTFRVLVVEDFDGVAVEDADDWCQKFRCEGRRAQADETKEDQDHQIHIALQYLPWPMSAYPLYASRRELNTIADIL